MKKKIVLSLKYPIIILQYYPTALKMVVQH